MKNCKSCESLRYHDGRTPGWSGGYWFCNKYEIKFTASWKDLQPMFKCINEKINDYKEEDIEWIAEIKE
jgi:hypothetical protein